MNTTLPNLNAPLLPYVNLQLVFHRWGFQQLGEAANLQFYRFLEQAMAMQGLKPFFDLSKPPSETVIEGDIQYCLAIKEGLSLSEVSEGFGALQFFWFNKEPNDLTIGDYHRFMRDEFSVTGKELLEREWIKESYSYTQNTEITTLTYLNSPKNFIEVDVFEISDTGIIPQRLVLNNNSPAVLCFHRYPEEDTLLGQSEYIPVPIGMPLDLESFYVEKNNLKAFEQKTGFFNHGLEHKEVMTYCPDPTPEQIAERIEQQSKHNPFAKINKERQLSEQQYLETFNVFKEFRDSGHKLDLSKEYTANELGIGKSTVHKRLKKAVELELITEQDIK